MSRPNLNRIEMGRQDISRESINGILAALRVTWEELQESNSDSTGSALSVAPANPGSGLRAVELSQEQALDLVRAQVMRLALEADERSLKNAVKALSSKTVGQVSIDKKKPSAG